MLVIVPPRSRIRGPNCTSPVVDPNESADHSGLTLESRRLAPTAVSAQLQ